MTKLAQFSLIALFGVLATDAIFAQARPLARSYRTPLASETQTTPVRFGGEESSSMRTAILNSSLQYRWGVMSDEEYSALPQQARDLFDLANSQADRVNYDGARKTLSEAAALAPNHLAIQFLLLKSSRQAAETSYGDESLQNYEVAAEALRRLTSNSALTPEERLRAGRESERIREGMNDLRKRDQRRLEDGFKFVKRLNASRVERFQSQLEVEEEAFPFVGIDELLNIEPPAEDSGPAVAENQIWTYKSAPGIQLPKPPALDAGQGGVFGSGFGNEFGGFQEFGSGPGSGGFDAAGFGASPDGTFGGGAAGDGFGGGGAGFSDLSAGGEFDGGGFGGNNAGFGNTQPGQPSFVSGGGGRK